MKKILPGMLMAVSAVAFAGGDITPTVYEDITVEAISANGEWIVGLTPDGYGCRITNLATGKEWDYEADLTGDMVNEAYQCGIGRCISNTGVVAGVRNEKAAYWENGTWTLLQDLAAEGMSAASAITPDGNIIVGYAGKVGMSVDAQELMSMPVVWYRQSDGSFGEPVLLPYPKTDITNRMPQYVNAVSISDDGKTVGASMRDFRGTLCQPLVICCDEQGNWTYQMLGNDILNPNHVVFPEFPGDFDQAAPNYEDYMTEEEVMAFLAAHQAWIEAGENPNTQPAPEDFMSASEREKYLTEYLPWLEKYLEWKPKYEAFENALQEVLESGSGFQFNNIDMSADGKWLVSTKIREEIELSEDFIEPMVTQYNSPVRFDTESGAFVIYSDEIPIFATAVTNDGSVLGNSFDSIGIDQKIAYIFIGDDLTATPLLDYISDTDADVAEWMVENMTHDAYVVQDYDWETGEVEATIQKIVCSGRPKCTPDLSVVGTSVSTAYWVEDVTAYIYSYVFPTGIEPSGIGAVSAEAEGSVSVDVEGRIVLKGEFAEVEAYNMAGMRILSVKNPSTVIESGLGSGLYVVRAIDAEGNVFIVKICL